MHEYTREVHPRVRRNIRPVSRIMCEGCRRPVLDLTDAAAIIPDVYDIGTILPVHHPYLDGGRCQRECLRRQHKEIYRNGLFAGERSDTLWEYVTWNVERALEYPGVNLSTTERSIGHKTLRQEIVRRTARVAAIYEEGQ